MKRSTANSLANLKALCEDRKRGGANTAVLAIVFAFVLAALPIDAMAAMSIPFIDGVGCQVANWMKGPLAILIFIVVCIATLVIGLISKMDWGRIINIAIIFGIIQGIVTILLSTGSIQLPSCLAA